MRLDRIFFLESGGVGEFRTRIKMGQASYLCEPREKLYMKGTRTWETICLCSGLL